MIALVSPVAIASWHNPMLRSLITIAFVHVMYHDLNGNIRARAYFDFKECFLASSHEVSPSMSTNTIREIQRKSNPSSHELMYFFPEPAEVTGHSSIKTAQTN